MRDRETGQFVRGACATVLDQGRWPDLLDRIARAVAARGIILLAVENASPARSIRVMQHGSSDEQDRPVCHYRRCLGGELADQEAIARLARADDARRLFEDDVIEERAACLRLKPSTRFPRRFGICHRAGALLEKDLCRLDRFVSQLPHGSAGARPRRGAVLVARGAERLPLYLGVCPIAGDDLPGEAGSRGFAVYSLDPEHA